MFYACLEVFRSEKTNNNEGALMATIDSMNRDTTRLSDGPDWTFELLETYLAEV
ncbi:SpoVR family protein, partial [Variovorax sp. WS11]